MEFVWIYYKLSLFILILSSSQNRNILGIHACFYTGFPAFDVRILIDLARYFENVFGWI